MRGKRIILTGAGGGIGSQLAGMLAHQDAALCLTDVNAEALQQCQESIAKPQSMVCGSSQETFGRLCRQSLLRIPLERMRWDLLPGHWPW